MLARLAARSSPASANRLAAVAGVGRSLRPVYLVVGVALLAVAIGDLLWTTLWAEGSAGPLSSRLSVGTWRGLRSVAGADSTLLTLSGPLILVLTLSTWLGLIWLGWTFVVAGGGHAIVDPNGSHAITWVQRLYFVGYSVFTLGNGGYVPADGVWELATTLMTASGMVLITLSVSYVLSVLEAVTRKRSFASSVTGLGSDAATLVENGWDGEDFGGLELAVNALASDLDLLVEQHQAYPILHYYHTKRAEKSAARAAVIFDDALTILRDGVAEDARPNRALVENARSSVENYLRTLDGGSPDSVGETPPPPDLDRLREAGVPTVSDEAFADAVERTAERRRRLLGMVRADGREWPSDEPRRSADRTTGARAGAEQ